MKRLFKLSLALIATSLIASTASAEYFSQIPRSCMIEVEGKTYLNLLDTPECHKIAREIDAKNKKDGPYTAPAAAAPAAPAPAAEAPSEVASE